jgi:hypothetical protein
MPLIENNFGCNILGGSTNSEGSSLSQKFGKAKICQFKVSIISNEEILRLEISENDVFVMKIFEA